MKSFSAVRNSKGFLYQLSEQDPFSTYEKGSATQVGWNKSILHIEDFFYVINERSLTYQL